MNERRWLQANKPSPLLEYVGEAASQRKQRLLGVACCRRVQGAIADSRFVEVVDTGEQFADGLLGTSELAAAHALVTPQNYWEEGPAYRLTAPIINADLVLGRCWQVVTLRDEQIAQSHLVRDIFGNPFRPVAFDPSWRTSTVVALAQQMYESRDFSPMPVLADALQDAGCEHEAILAHCRGVGPHARGCWVVDLILGKS